KAALAIEPDDVDAWLALSRAYIAYVPNAGNQGDDAKRNGLSAALSAYDLSRTSEKRAQSLAIVATGLDLRDLSRPALTAYADSLKLVDDDTVRAAYDDLRARKGFRVVNHSI